MIDNDEVGLKKARRFLIALFGTAHLGIRRGVVGDARGRRSTIIRHITPKHLQWQFLESLCEDKFVIQLGALTNQRQVSVNPNPMVALSLHSITTKLRSHGMCIDYHNFLCF